MLNKNDCNKIYKKKKRMLESESFFLEAREH